jgi:polyphosphate kinase 2
MTETEKPAFDIRAPGLPKEIDEAAFRSGGFLYGHRLKKKAYLSELRSLQIELVKMLDGVRRNGLRVVVLFEGRDAAGKGGTIQRLTEHLNPRSVRIVALPKPDPGEEGQWYFQRYAAQLPARGEIAVFDRSWYNRAGVERVFGFCTPEQTKAFLKEAPVFEAMLVRDGIILVKFFLSIGREMQMARLHARWHDPLSRWKLSDIDYKAVEKWHDYSAAFNRMLEKTDTVEAPWTVLHANDKRRLRLAAIRGVLDQVPYEGKDKDAIGVQDDKIVSSAARFLKASGEPG